MPDINGEYHLSWKAACHDITQWVTSAGLLYCMEFLEQNMDWLQERMEPLFEGDMAVRRFALMTMLWDTGACLRILAACHLLPKTILTAEFWVQKAAIFSWIALVKWSFSPFMGAFSTLSK